ncbi:phage tail tape measure protein [Rhodocyclus tenuis]|uniref:TP901 family phage tail tape measure protein n=1 Tax=Rhodocyclus tenuis TaxID=1066 RepID=A0A840G5E4_RHOTE|nr:phage tail tape measure protein [Rhodocyclus tenuis]MBB4246561.1 TP901 family phage tail tape measure protein [Rhodocyclus tenuis]
MSNRDLSLALRLYTDSARFVAGLTQAGGSVSRFAKGAKREIDTLKGAMSSLQGQLATLGVSVGAVATAAQSGRMDKSLTQIGQTAGMSRGEVEKLRSELFRMSGETGQNVDDLQGGFNNAVQAGLKFSEALPVIDATNKAMAVTGASADRLTSGLTVASTAFNFDLSKPGLAALLLDKMTVAGRQGNAELQNLSDIFARVGVNAASAGMGFDQTLAFIETLSQVEKQPERLSTLADSTLRLFTNLKYMKAAASATGVKFFDAKGERRNVADIFNDLKAKYDTLKTDKARAIFLQNAFGEADLDTIKGLKTLLGGNSLSKFGEFSAAIGAAGGAISRDLPEAISNSIDQTGRLKAALRLAADDFVRPLNDTYQKWVGFALDKKENGGLGIDGKDMILGGALGAAGIFGAARYGGKAVGALAKRFGGTAAGVAEGKALEAAMGVTPVFVVNWPASMGGAADIAGAAAGAGAGGAAAKAASRAKSLAVLAGGLPLSAWGSMGAAGLATAGTGVVGAGAAGYGIGSAINQLLNWGTSKLSGEQSLGALIYEWMHSEESKVGGEIRVRVDQDGRVSSVAATTSNPRVPMNVDAGRTMVTP